MVSCLCSAGAKKAYASIVMCTAAMTYLAGGIFASTAVKVSEAYTQYCADGFNGTVSTPFGSMSCTSLSGLVKYQDITATSFAWGVPILTFISGAIAAKYIIEACNNPARPMRRWQVLLHNQEQQAKVQPTSINTVETQGLLDDGDY